VNNCDLEFIICVMGGHCDCSALLLRYWFDSFLALSSPVMLFGIILLVLFFICPPKNVAYEERN
jgi:hypothetical protein